MTPYLELAANYEAARAIGPWLTTALETLDAPQAARVGELELALHELAINIIDHAYDETTRPDSVYRIDLSRDGDDLRALFSDSGTAFVDNRPPQNDEPSIGGYGLMIVEQLASSITYERINDENRWTLVFGP